MCSWAGERGIHLTVVIQSLLSFAANVTLMSTGVRLNFRLGVSHISGNTEHSHRYGAIGEIGSACHVEQEWYESLYIPGEPFLSANVYGHKQSNGSYSQHPAFTSKHHHFAANTNNVDVVEGSTFSMTPVKPSAGYRCMH